MKALVIGGAGFVGSNLCEELLKDHIVFSLDDYSSGSEDNHLEGVTYIKGHTKDISRLIDFEVDIVYHLGEYSRVEQSFDDIEKVVDSNVLGTISVIEFWRKKKFKLVYAGSSTKFSMGTLGKNQSPYAFSKASNTELVCNYGSWFDLPYAITYFYNVYGRREIEQGRYATLIAIFKRKYLNGESLTVVEPGHQKRNFTYIDDVVSALILIGAKGEGDGFGIACDESFSVLEIASMFGGKLKMLPARKGNRIDGEVVSEKTKSLGWNAKTNIVDHIVQYKKNIPRT